MIQPAKVFPGEVWKEVIFDPIYTNVSRVQVSNFGRLRSFNKISDGNILRGTLINGYRILRLKLLRPRDPKVQAELDRSEQQVFKLAKNLRELIANKERKAVIEEAEKELNAFKKKLSKRFSDDLKSRMHHYHALYHRLVAEYFLPKPGPQRIVVAHIDYDKLNNRASNLKWMTREENYEHQSLSPYVIQEKQARKVRRKEASRATKLSVTKVMLMKKLINEGKPMKQLVKLFKVTSTQILRIKRGENWCDVPAAK